jgi:hypothetical protein
MGNKATCNNWQQRFETTKRGGKKMNFFDWLKIFHEYPNVSPCDVSKAKEHVNQLVVCQYGAVTPLEYALQSLGCKFETIRWMIQVLDATPKYPHLALANRGGAFYDFDFKISHFLHEMGVRYVSFDEYSRHVSNARNGLHLGEKELVEFVLCYRKYWYIGNNPDLEPLVKIAAHRRRAALGARVALVASLKRRIGKDMVCKIIGYMKEGPYVAKEEWGWSE